MFLIITFLTFLQYLDSRFPDCVTTPSTLVGEGGDEGRMRNISTVTHPHLNPLAPPSTDIPVGEQILAPPIVKGEEECAN